MGIKVLTSRTPPWHSRGRRGSQGKAVGKRNKLGIYYVQLVDEPSGREKQNISAGIDPGKYYSGIGLQSKLFTLFTAHLFLPFEMVKKRMDSRSMNQNEQKMYRKCGICTYDYNNLDADRCESCKNALENGVTDKTFPEGNILLLDRIKKQFSKGSANFRLWLSTKNINPRIKLHLTNFQERVVRDISQKRAVSTIALGLLLGSTTTLIIIKVFFKPPNQNSTPSTDLESKSNNIGSAREQLSRNSDETNVEVYPDFASVEGVPQGKFYYGGSICFAPLMREGFYQKVEDRLPQFQLEYLESQNPGCAADIKPLLANELAFILNARQLTEEDYLLARNRGTRLESTIVGFDAVTPYLNKSNEIGSLTLKQLQDIYLGEITNWQQLGGTNLPITVVALNPNLDADVQLLLKEKKPKSGSFEIVRDYTSAIRRVSRTPGAIAIGSAAILKGQNSVQPIAVSTNETNTPVTALLADGAINLQALNFRTYPLIRSLSVVYRQGNSLDSQAAIAYINLLVSEQGQELVSESGFLPVYRN